MKRQIEFFTFSESSNSNFLLTLLLTLLLIVSVSVPVQAQVDREINEEQQVLPRFGVYEADYLSSLPSPTHYDYPYRGSQWTTSHVDAYGFYVKNCTSFAAWFVNRACGITSPSEVAFFFNTMTNPRLSHARFWRERLEAAGYVVNNIPAYGAVRWIPPGQCGTSSEYGHVQIDLGPAPGGGRYVAEYNGGTGTYREFISTCPALYIHVNSVRLAQPIQINAGAPVRQGEGIRVAFSLRNDGPNRRTVIVRAALYNNAQQFVGEIGSELVTLNSRQTTSVINICKPFLTSAPGQYTVRVEVRNTHGLDVSNWYLASPTSGNVNPVPVTIHQNACHWFDDGGSTASATLVQLPTANTAQATRDGSICGTFDDIDIFRFDSRHNNVRLELTGTNVSSLPTNLRLELLNRFGQVVRTSDASGNAAERITVNGLGTGTYFARVSLSPGRCTGFNKIDSYRLRVTTSTSLLAAREDLPFALESSTELTIYPNPTRGAFAIKSTPATDARIEIIDAIGRRVHTEQLLGNEEGSWNIQLPETPAGIYLLKYEAENGDKRSIRLIVE